MVKNITAAEKTKTSLVLVIALIIALAACAMAGYLFLELKKITENLTQQSNVTGVEKKQPLTEPLYVSLKTFTVSLKPTAPNDNRVIYIGLTMRVEDKTSQALVEKVLPEVRSRINMLLSQQTADQLINAEGKKALLKNLTQELSQPITSGHQLAVSDVLLNEFIIR